MTEILLRSRGEKPAVALTSARRLLEYRDLERPAALSAEAVLLGSAGRVMKSLAALFVVLPGGEEGFLPFGELAGGISPRPGDPLVVQVKKPRLGDKAPLLSMDVSLPGRLCMLLPQGGAAHASRRARDPAALGALAGSLRPQGMGLVLRANAEGASREEIQSELSIHLAQWEAILALSRSLSAPAMLREAPAPLERLMRDLREVPQRVIADDERAAAGLGLPVETSVDPFALYGVERQLAAALRRRVYLPSGGTLVLDPCEAALVIDVNTAQDARTGGDPILRTNLEAAGEIPRLLRLRRAGGSILIDFIGMTSEEQRKAVQERLRDGLREDPVSTEVLGFTRLGLVEMTRRKADVPLPAVDLLQGPEANDREDANA